MGVLMVERLRKDLGGLCPELDLGSALSRWALALTPLTLSHSLL